MKILLFTLLTISTARLLAQEVPSDSQMATAANAKQKYALAPLENPADITPGAFNLNDYKATVFEEEKPPGHKAAVLLSADAIPPGGKGDYHCAKNLQPGTHWVGGWFYLGPESNVKRLGIQFHEKSGEYMAAFWPADFEGWKWLETELTDNTYMQQAHAQPESDGVLQPDDVDGISIVWWTSSGGPTQLGVTGLVSGGGE